MRNHVQTAPSIRFKGFTEDWEPLKLGDLAESFNYGLNASATEFDGENKYIRITDIDDKSHKFIQSGLTSPNAELSNADDYLLKEGDILFARTGASVGKSYQYDRLDGKVYYAGFLIRARIKPEFNPSFIFQNTVTERYKNFIKIASQRSGQPGVNAQEYANFSLLVPTKEEQSKIGAFFKQLDTTITLQQKQLSNYKEMKTALLQKMFPKAGEKMPEVRFEGFTGEWEERKLGALYEKGGSGGTPKSTNKSFYLGDIPFLGISDVSASNGYIFDTEKHISEEGLKSSSAWIVPKEAISLAMYASVGKVAILKTDAATSQAFYNMTFEHISTRNFVFQYLLKMESMKGWNQLISTGTQSNLNAQKVRELKIMIPSLEEQSAIGAFLQQLDDTITHHQQQLDNYKELKKAMLQNLFI